MKHKTNMKQETETVVADTMAQTNRDLVYSVLIVSLLINVAVFIGWIALRVTSAYDAEVAALLFVR